MANNSEPKRRDFLLAMAAILGSSSSTYPHISSKQGKPDHPTVQDVIDTIIADIPGGRIEKTVDTLKTGDLSQPVTGIATTFMATCDVIHKTLDAEANFIITHEPTFYNHLDEVDWLKGDPVYEYKKRLLSENKIAVWRFHDHWHQWNPDPMDTALLQDLGWVSLRDQELKNVCVIEPTSLLDLAHRIKRRLGIRQLRVIGEPDLRCRRIAFMPGASGGRRQIGFLSRENVDVLICGEVAEWETSEYVRDSARAGQPKALILLGHVNSEEAGMRVLVDWLKPRLPGLNVKHIPAEDPFMFV